jgi:hypothetical protein
MMKRIKLSFVAMSALVLFSCGDASSTDPVYEAFQSNSASDGMDLSQYSGYTMEYVNERARLLCQIMDRGDQAQLTIQLNFGDTPGGLLSKPDKDGVLQKIIWRSGTPILCPQHNQYIQQQSPATKVDIHKWYAGTRYVGTVVTGNNLVWKCDDSGTCVLEGAYMPDLNMAVCQELSAKVGGLSYYSNDTGMIWDESSPSLNQCNGK